MIDRPTIYRLVSLDGGGTITLGAITILGRASDCEACFDCVRISRRHCCIVFDRAKSVVIVRDLGSTNGTRVNGYRVQEATLRRGDILAIADRRFVLVVEEEAK